MNGGLVNGHLLLRDHPHHHHHHHHQHVAPAPPPQKAEKRSRHKENKGTRLYLKHLPGNGVGVVNGVVPAANSPLGLGHTARYKSMTNIHGAMELDPALAGAPTTPTPPLATPAASSGTPGASGGCGGVGTLDSSHSGGRTSGDSGNKLPEKRSRKLSRPRCESNYLFII